MDAFQNPFKGHLFNGQPQTPTGSGANNPTEISATPETDESIESKLRRFVEKFTRLKNELEEMKSKLQVSEENESRIQEEIERLKEENRAYKSRLTGLSSILESKGL